MVGNQDRWREDIFVACPLRDLVPDDHILKRFDRVLDLSWLRDEVADCYCSDNGRPSIDPEAALRLMLAGFFAGIVHDRKLMREAQVNLAMRWFAGYRLHEELPDHSSLTRIRQRWGEERFKHIFQRTVTACCTAGLVDGETVHIDATLIRADVSWESVVEDHAEQVLLENSGENGNEQRAVAPSRQGPPRSHKGQIEKHSLTDPEATIATSSHERRMEPCFKQNTAVDDRTGVIVDVAVTTGEDSEGKQLLEQVARVEGNTEREVKTVTADAGYAHPRNYAELEKNKIEAVIPPQREPGIARKLPARRFKYDARYELVHCPGGKTLHPGKEKDDSSRVYQSRSCDCRNCPLRERCLPPSSCHRTIRIVLGYEALLRARRRKARGWDADTRELYQRHQWRVEGKHGEAKTLHGLRRAVRRGRWNVAIQAYLTAAVMNLKCLAALLLMLFIRLFRPSPRSDQPMPASSPI
ncbi:IS1182 family transposase [candidate division WOR-3 bacterium]|uniref:IS1182 family transposase n=1 Tax=candidate division WOR-3 bacterium TaxID=2052148 RepID=A0A937XHZ0_UNCW3|nr:IS1182 family transposase [candidate division WOR-3 bacterium]